MSLWQRFNHFMTVRVPEKYENNIYAFVFFGATFLVLIVGLRGLGKDAQDIGSFVSWFIDDKTGRVSEKWVFAALLFECFMLLVMAVTLFFKPEGHSEQKTSSMTTTTAESHVEINIRGSKTQVINSLSDLKELVSKSE